MKKLLTLVTLGLAALGIGATAQTEQATQRFWNLITAPVINGVGVYQNIPNSLDNRWVIQTPDSSKTFFIDTYLLSDEETRINVSVTRYNQDVYSTSRCCNDGRLVAKNGGGDISVVLEKKIECPVQAYGSLNVIREQWTPIEEFMGDHEGNLKRYYKRDPETKELKVYFPDQLSREEFKKAEIDYAKLLEIASKKQKESQ